MLISYNSNLAPINISTKENSIVDNQCYQVGIKIAVGIKDNQNFYTRMLIYHYQ